MLLTDVVVGVAVLVPVLEVALILVCVLWVVSLMLVAVSLEV